MKTKKSDRPIDPTDECLAKARHLWESPGPWDGNAVVIMHQLSETEVLVGDLDAGENYTVLLSDLVKRLRKAEGEDYGYSWTCDAHEAFVAQTEEDDS